MRPSVLHAPDSMKAHWSVSGISSQPVSTGSSATARALQPTNTNPRTPHGQYRRGDEEGEMEVVSLGPSTGLSNLRRGATIEGASSDSASMKATMATRLASLIHVRCRFCSRASMRAASCRLISSMPSIECVGVDGDVVCVDVVVEEDDRGTSGIDGAMRGRARQCVNDGASRRRSWFVACARA